MSSSISAVHGVADAAPAERRFYRRTTPSKLLYVAFGADNLGMLVNVSESGLMVSTPERLALNSVFRVELHLNGFSNTIKVHVRTVWTANLQKHSGIQLLDLSEPDRELIRKWGRQQLPRNQNPDEINPPENLESSLEAELVRAEPPEEVKFVPAVVPPLSFEGLGMDDFGNDLVAIPADDLPPRKRASSSKLLLLIAWSAAMAAVCLGTGWSYRRELADRFLKQPAHQAGATYTAKENENIAADRPALIATGINVTPVPSAAAPGSAPAKTATAADAPQAARSNASDEGTLEADRPVDKQSASDEKRTPGYERNLNAPAQQSREVAERPVPPEIADSTTFPMKSPMKNGIASTASPVEARSSAKISTLVPVGGGLSASTPAQMPVEPQLSANASTPAQVEFRTPANSGQAAVETRPSENVTEQPPPQNRPVPNSGASFTSNAKVLSVDPPIKSAITGSIAPGNPGRLRASLSSQPNSSSFASRSSASPSANPPISRGASNAVDRSSKPTVIQMDVPAARVVELTSTSHSASYVLLSGEQVLKSNAMTIHVRRSVRVPGDHWLLWRSHKRVVLGGLTSRVDPQIPRAPSSGTITVQATIAEDGQVINVKSLNGNLAFLSNVTTALNEWRYEPTYVDNKPVETQAQIELDFHPVTTLRASQR
jgi:PilZ domain/Gram-negative bacterial TonB protein C-terminal